MWQRNSLMPAAAAMSLLVVASACQSPAAPATESSGVSANPEAAPAPPGTTNPESHTIQTMVVEEGSATVLVAVVEPTEGYHCNMEFPNWTVSMDDTSALLAGQQFDRSVVTEFTEGRVEFRIPLTEDLLSPARAAGMLRFSVCDDETCLTPREPVSWEVATAQ